MKCKYYNCEWRGTFGTVEDHLAACKITLEPCPNDGCEDRIKRMDLHNHVKNECPNREHECEWCKEKGTFQQITQFHDQNCRKFIVECPNAECDKRFERCHSDVHLAKDCEYTKIPCKHCGIEVTRKNWDEHKQSDIHVLYWKVARAAKVTKSEKERTTHSNFLLWMLLFITGVSCAVALNALYDARDAKELVASMQADIDVLKSLNDSQTIQTLKVSQMNVSNKILSLSRNTASLEKEFGEKTTSLEEEFNSRLAELETAMKKKIETLAAAMETKLRALEKKARALEDKAGPSKGVASQSAPQATTSYKAKSRSGGACKTKSYSSLILFCVAIVLGVSSNLSIFLYWAIAIIIALRLFALLYILYTVHVF